MFKKSRILMSIPVGISLLAGVSTVSAQTIAPRLGIELLTSGLTSPINASSTDNVMARLVLDTTGSPEGVRISSLPFILTTGNGAASGTLTNCTVVNEASPSVDLNTAPGNGVGLVSGLNTINLTSPLVLAAGTVTTLSLRCDASANLVSGGTFTFSMNTANVSATGVSTGLPAIVSVRGAVPPVVIPPVVIPTVPNTGAGGAAAGNWALLLGSITLAAVGFAFTRKAAQASR